MPIKRHLLLYKKTFNMSTPSLPPKAYLSTLYYVDNFYTQYGNITTQNIVFNVYQHQYIEDFSHAFSTLCA